MIRKLHESDIDVLVEMEKNLFPGSPWPKEFFEYEVKENPYAEIYIYEEDGEIIGYIDFWITFEQAQVSNIAVKEECWNKGIGSALIEYAIDNAIEHNCENISLEVKESNEQAIHLYKKYGFEEVSKRKHYYENGEDALHMVKPIGGLTDDNAVSD